VTATGIVRQWDRYIIPQNLFLVKTKTGTVKQESRAVARKPLDATAVLFGLKFANSIHYKFQSSQVSKARLQSSKHIGAKQNLMQMAILGHSGSSIWSQWKGESVEMR